VVSDYPESTYAVLGLVDKVSGASGYELTAVARRSFAHFWPISQTLLYRELERLTGLGWVTATAVDQPRAPRKVTYRTTHAGEEALAGWLDGSTPPTTTFRSGALLRMFFAYRMSPAQVRLTLEEYRTAVQSQYDEFHAITEKLEAIATPEAQAGRLTALHGLRTAEAALAWTREVEAMLEEGYS